MRQIFWLIVFAANISHNIEMQESQHNKFTKVKSDQSFQLTLQSHLPVEDNTLLCE